MNARTRWIAGSMMTMVSAGAYAQIPDLLNSFEMGGRSMGMGGSINSNITDVSASYWNPAGLGHISTSAVEVNFRNRPSNNTTLTGTFTNPDESTAPQYGRNQISFLGAAVPVGRGTIGISYAVGGYARELRHGEGLVVDPGENITANVDTLDAITDEFITLAYGFKSGNAMALGLGLVFARESILSASRIELFQNGNPIPGPDPTDTKEDATGIGGIIGAQFASGPSSSFGISFRTPISLSGYDELSSYADHIPGRLQGGFLFRKDGMRGGKDYLIAGIDAAYFFETNRGKALQRDGHISGGVGFEYNLSQRFGWIPIRLGVRATSKGGPGFKQRNVITFGLGYRPHGGNMWLDFAAATGSGQNRPDFALSVGTKLGR
ncbi:MAG: hypothetical protein M3R13_11210 [Armatimonadota bacterium]|nr:hypothetical protein [Armatimonadota bacterium]